SYFTNVNGTLFFRLNDIIRGCGIWKSDGTIEGTVLAHRFPMGTASSSPGVLTGAGGTLFFRADDGLHGGTSRLWKSDGTALGTKLINDSVWGSYLTNVDGTLYFVQSDSLHG